LENIVEIRMLTNLLLTNLNLQTCFWWTASPWIVLLELLSTAPW